MWLRDLFLTNRFFVGCTLVVLLFVAAFFVPMLFVVAQVALVSLVALAVADVVLLFRRKRMDATRVVPNRLSNGDPNQIDVALSSGYPFATRTTVIDETPKQFQIRDGGFDLRMQPNGTEVLRYSLRPTERGVFNFGAVNVYCESPLGLVQRRYQFSRDADVPVYPSFIQMRKYALMATSDRLSELGIKQIRRLGHSMEFDQIRPYVRGDDQRTINWKATARSRKLMVNQFMDERSQKVYCCIDVGRVMKMPFEGLTLLDYSINASLALANVSIIKEDKAGLITFSDKVSTSIPASKRADQMGKLLHALYAQDTDFKETGYQSLVAEVRRRAATRSLLLLFTNFESVSGMRRQLPYLRILARRHLVVVVFFSNTELEARLGGRPESMEDVYIKAVAEQFAMEKKEIVSELKRHGIMSLLTRPTELTVNAINMYLEIKARRML